MLSINTNLSSLIAQRSMTQATNILNQAIERMTTGYKINHAKDNAANYSIATNMTTKINGLMVAEDNASTGLDLITTAEGTLSLIEDKLTRLRALQEQASNGTYGQESLKAINSEANALVDEVNRIYSIAEFNGIKLFDGAESTPEVASYAMARSTPSQGGFIQEITQRDTSGMDKLSEADPDTAITGGTYSISTVAELKKLATMTNAGLIQGGEFVLANDIDLSEETNWTPIGYRDSLDLGSTTGFVGTFDGNGYIVSNLTINSTVSGDMTGLFGKINTGEIKNLGIENATITTLGSAGVLSGGINDAVINNCYAIGDINSAGGGGLIGVVRLAEIQNSWADVDVVSTEYGGGLVCRSLFGAVNINNCYALGDVSSGYEAGGILGMQYYFDPDGTDTGTITRVTNSFSLGKVTGSPSAGILYSEQEIYVDSVSNCYYNSELNQGVNGLAIKSDRTNYAPANAVVGKTTAELEAMIPTLHDYPSGLPETGGGAGGGTGGTGSGGATAPIGGMITFQIGLGAGESSRISLDVSFALSGLDELRNIGLDNGDYLTTIDNMLGQVLEKQTQFGAASNRLESALDEISTQYENLVSSRSTIRDADIAEVSSTYIQQQILQQASATLLATANQSPSIALQLI